MLHEFFLFSFAPYSCYFLRNILLHLILPLDIPEWLSACSIFSSVVFAFVSSIILIFISCSLHIIFLQIYVPVINFLFLFRGSDMILNGCTTTFGSMAAKSGPCKSRNHSGLKYSPLASRETNSFSRSYPINGLFSSRGSSTLLASALHVTSCFSTNYIMILTNLSRHTKVIVTK